MGRRSPAAGLTELVRIFMTPGALADSHAGVALAAWTAGVPLRPEWALAAGATSALAYWFGMVTNDLWDLPRDRSRAPRRPLPAGDVSVRAARVTAGVLAALVIALAALLGILPWALGLLAAIVLYNAGGKRLGLVGDALMGSCRGLNLLVGAAVAATAAGVSVPQRALPAAAILGGYVLVVTAVSRREDRPRGPSHRGVGPWATLLAPAAVVALRPDALEVWIHAGLLLAALGFAWRAAAAAAEPGRGAAIFVGRSLGAVPILDASLLVASAPRIPNVAPLGVLYGLFVLGWLWRRRRARRGREES